MLLRCASCLLFASLTFSAASQTGGKEPKTSMEWFARARDNMNLRVPGSAPFHIKVTFHAFPGVELRDEKSKPEIVTGDGTYEEIWLAPHQWRREVSLADYHAIEVQSELARKMQASSDYEPSRVLMLLSRILDPIPRNLVSREFKHDGASGWDVLNNKDLPLVRISKTFERSGVTLSTAYYFLPRGALAIENNHGLQTSWEDDVLFAGRIVPQHITVKAGERTLLTANVTIEPAGESGPERFDLRGGPADPGMTLRALPWFEIKPPAPLSDVAPWNGPDNSALSLLGVVDRSGKYRELEMIIGVNTQSSDNKTMMADLRKAKWSPPEIDKSHCEFVFLLNYIREVHTTFSRQ
jgi:hypothetical protein